MMEPIRISKIGARAIHSQSLGDAYSAFANRTAEGRISTQGVSVRQQRAKAPTAQEIDTKLFESRSSFKVAFANIAMHLSSDWRSKLFSQIDALLSPGDWEASDLPVSGDSSLCFIRTILYLKPERRPSVGATQDGNLIAAWTNGENRLTLECRPNDLVRWLVTADLNGHKDTAAGFTTIVSLRTILQPYRPEQWLLNARG